MTRAPFAPLFLVSLATVGFEIALTRFFAVAQWSEYGYWVISIVLAGFAFSGVVLALAREALARRGATLLAALPAALIVAAALGYAATTQNPFNPLQLQNPVTFSAQILNIGLYYVVLLPFFFLAGLYISLCFVLNEARIGRIYACDLAGAGAGALVVLALMAFVPPFHLLAALLPALALASLLGPVRRPGMILAALLALIGAEALLLAGPQPEFNQSKAIFAPLHVADSRVVATRLSPHGDYALLDDFTERVDTDLSNDAGPMGLPDPPKSYGLYRDGNRLAALSKGPISADYAAATLSALPYRLQHPGGGERVLLAGASGGFRIAEAHALGARAIEALEPEPILADALRHGLGPSPASAAAPGLVLSERGPIAATLEGGNWDIIDLSADFLDSTPGNESAFSAEAIALYLRALAPGGVVSIPVSIREFPAYAVRMLATVRAGLGRAGIADAPAHVLAIRSAWNVRLLVFRDPVPPATIAAARKFAADFSFDISYYPGIDPVAARADIFNDLPAVSFATGEVEDGGGEAHDAIADEAGAVLHGQISASGTAFDLSPITLDRPAFYAVLRLSQLGTLLRRIEILPQAELGPLVNLAVLVQAIVVAALVLAVPLLGRSRFRAGGGMRTALRAALYFAALGLGFLAIEMVMIERAAFLLEDRTLGLSLVLSAMLVFSGLGSLLSERFAGGERRAMAWAGALVLLWCALMLAGLQPLLLAALDWPMAARIALLLGLLAPVSVALGMPFPLGLARMPHDGFLPWAWGLNGAFSVVATPLANLIAVKAGFDWVLFLALILYGSATLSFPSMRKARS